jgi:hypothetical protein
MQMMTYSFNKKNLAQDRVTDQSAKGGSAPKNPRGKTQPRPQKQGLLFSQCRRTNQRDRHGTNNLGSIRDQSRSHHFVNIEAEGHGATISSILKPRGAPRGARGEQAAARRSGLRRARAARG